MALYFCGGQRRQLGSDGILAVENCCKGLLDWIRKICFRIASFFVLTDDVGCYLLIPSRQHLACHWEKVASLKQLLQVTNWKRPYVVVGVDAGRLGGSGLLENLQHGLTLLLTNHWHSSQINLISLSAEKTQINPCPDNYAARYLLDRLYIMLKGWQSLQESEMQLNDISSKSWI